MNEQLPAPEFDRRNYARPNQNWTCGYAAEGRACPLGPDRFGRCQAAPECKPVLEVKPGETKGRWHCTRPGGACETGPLPDGTCCRTVSKCSPVPSLRRQRGRFTLFVTVATMAFLLLVLGSPSLRTRFINPGALSRFHSGSAFAALAADRRIDSSCGACHQAGTAGPVGLIHAALHADPTPFELVKQAVAAPAEVSAIDHHCENCHGGHAFHQPMVVTISCTYCHEEHRGEAMAATTDADCTFCHGNAKTMSAAATAGEHLPASAFHLAGVQAQLAFLPQRPAQGFTTVIHHFATDHPQFRVKLDHWRDPDTLKFNHELHLTGSTIPSLPGGRKLDCTFCHQLDLSGKYMRPVNFERNCRVCHSLQFDPSTPELQLPHGDVEATLAFLHSLPRQYAGLAARQGILDAAGQSQFVQARLDRLRQDFGSGEDLVRRVFFSDARTGPVVQLGSVSGNVRAVFPGCAYCHEVKASADHEAMVTPPEIFERWLVHAKFDHARHASLACEKCHAARNSRDTADVLLPAREICVECHSPHGGVADTCATCHVYHRILTAGR